MSTTRAQQLPGAAEALAEDARTMAAARWRIMMVLPAVHLVGSATSFGLAALIPILQAELDLSIAQAGLIMAAVFAGFIVVAVPIGWLSDLVGVRRVLPVALLIQALGLAALSQAQSLAGLLALLLCVGIGYGALMPLATKLVVDWFPGNSRGTVSGLNLSMVPIGSASAAATFPSLALAYGWRGLFVGMGLAMLAMAVLFYSFYRDRSPISSRGRTAPRVTRQDLFDRDNWLLSLVSICFNTLQTALLAYIVLFLKEVWGFSVVVAGGYLAIMQIGGAIGRTGWGVISDRVFGGRRRIVLQILGAGNAVLALALGLTPPSAGPLWIGVIVACFGFTAFGWNALKFAYLGELAGRERVGRLAGINFTISHVGTMSGPALFGLLVEAIHSFPMSWMILTVNGIVAVLVLARMREGRET